MTSAQQATRALPDAPGPGTWTIDAVHHPRPVTAYWVETHPEPFRRGFREFTRFYGMLLDEIAIAYVDGFVYHQPRPIPDEEFPTRAARAEEVWERKLWREQLREWDETFKPRSIRTHQELQAVDADALDTEGLVAYLTRCRDHHAEMIFQHMRFTGAAMVAIGDLLAHAGDWTGIPPARLLGMMRGAAPVSAGASGELQRLVAAFESDPEARELLGAGADAGEVLRALRERDGETGAAVSGYLDLVGYRLLDGFDIAGRYALELPDALVRAMRSAVTPAPARGTDAAERIAEVRGQVPEAHRGEFDDLLEEARTTYRIRDERGVYSDVWASGIMRRAMLAAGRRLADAGRLKDAEHAVDAGLKELCALLRGQAGPSADELAERHAWRESRTAKDAPAAFGPPPAPQPDPSGLPPALARVMRAMGIVIDAMFAGSEEPQEERRLRGLAASSGVYEGPARRVSGPADFGRIAQGDVIVTEATTEAFNILLPLLGAIVTDSGGLLSHAAIVAREYGVPGVVGTREATQRIPDGATVRVDGDRGEVTVRS